MPILFLRPNFPAHDEPTSRRLHFDFPEATELPFDNSPKLPLLSYPEHGPLATFHKRFRRLR